MSIKKTSLLVLILLAACNNDKHIGDPRLDHKVIGVAGVVRDAQGAAVSGASIQTTAFRGSCGGDADGTATTTTASDGSFSTILSGSASEGARCVRVQVSKGQLTGTVEAPNVMFPTRFPTDTLKVQIAVH